MNKKVLNKIISVLAVLALLFLSLTICTVSSVDSNTDSNPKIRYYFKNKLNCLAETENPEEFKEATELDQQVEITYELNYKPYESELIDQLNINSTHDQVDTYIKNFRSEAKKYYSEQNEQFLRTTGIDKNSQDYELTISEYSPYIQVVCEDFSAYIDNENILVNKLVSNTSLSCINIGVLVEFEIQFSRTNIRSNYPMSQVLSDIGVTNQSYTGKRIKVGIMEAEGIADSSSHSELNGVNIFVNGDGELSKDSHAIDVTRILCGSNGVATGIEAAYIYQIFSATSFIPAMNWFLNSGCCLVNASLGFELAAGAYFWVSPFIDYNVRFNFITFVNSAGNTGNSSNHYVTPPATGYNVISVGNTTSTFEVLNSSSYGQNEYLQQLKPTLSAPGTQIIIGGENIGSGTSYSAPVVTGVIARLMQQRPELRSRPDLFGAILMASAMPAANQSDEWDEYAGAGIVNYAKAQSAINNTADIYCKNSSVGTVRQSLSFRAPAGKIKIAAYWLANSITTNNKDNIAYSIHTNYDLILQDNFYHDLKASESLNNIEYIVFNNSYERYLCAQIKQIEAKKTDDIDFGAVAWCCA